MKKSILFLFLTTVMASNAFATCEDLKGYYRVSGEYFGSDLISDTWGAVSIGAVSEDASSCSYPISAKVKTYADPLQSGKQVLAISKNAGLIGYPFTLTNFDGSQAGSGTFMHGFKRLTLSVERTGCGGEGGDSDCGLDIILE